MNDWIWIAWYVIVLLIWFFFRSMNLNCVGGARIFAVWGQSLGYRGASSYIWGHVGAGPRAQAGSCPHPTSAAHVELYCNLVNIWVLIDVLSSKRSPMSIWKFVLLLFISSNVCFLTVAIKQLLFLTQLIWLKILFKYQDEIWCICCIMKLLMSGWSNNNTNLCAVVVVCDTVGFMGFCCFDVVFGAYCFIGIGQEVAVAGKFICTFKISAVRLFKISDQKDWWVTVQFDLKPIQLFKILLMLF